MLRGSGRNTTLHASLKNDGEQGTNLDHEPQHYLDGIRNPTTSFEFLNKLNQDLAIASQSWISGFVEKALGIDVLIEVLSDKLEKERYTYHQGTSF